MLQCSDIWPVEAWYHTFIWPVTERVNENIKMLFVCCSELTLDGDEADSLCIESWRTWYILLQYGLAVDTFR